MFRHKNFSPLYRGVGRENFLWAPKKFLLDFLHIFSNILLLFSIYMYYFLFICCGVGGPLSKISIFFPLQTESNNICGPGLQSPWLFNFVLSILVNSLYTLMCYYYYYYYYYYYHHHHHHHHHHSHLSFSFLL
jgi:hypothetical protein